MESNIIFFFFISVLILFFAGCVIFASRMFMSLICLFLLVCSTGFLYLTLNAKYIAVFQFILCGIFLSVYIFMLLRKIGRLSLKLKLVNPAKIITGVFWVLSFGLITVLFFREEFNNSLYSIFNFLVEKSFDSVKFAINIFPLHLIIILVIVTAIVLRIFLVQNKNEEEQQ